MQCININRTKIQKRYHVNKNKKFIKKLRDAKSTDSKVYWDMLNEKQPNKIEPSIKELYTHFKNPK